MIQITSLYEQVTIGFDYCTAAAMHVTYRALDQGRGQTHSRLLEPLLELVLCLLVTLLEAALLLPHLLVDRSPERVVQYI